MWNDVLTGNNFIVATSCWASEDALGGSAGNVGANRFSPP